MTLRARIWLGGLLLVLAVLLTGCGYVYVEAGIGKRPPAPAATPSPSPTPEYVPVYGAPTGETR